MQSAQAKYYLFPNNHLIGVINEAMDLDERVRGLAFSSEGLVPNLQNVGVDKTATPLFWQQKFYDPITDTL